MWTLVWRGFVLLLFGASGCQTLSLPAIDTTGNRIFSPTRPMQFLNPHDPNNGYPSIAPAYQHPPEPPQCTQTGDRKLCKGCLTGKGCLFAKKKATEDMRGRCGELLITPNRLVAPVGGEVIVLAGICGKDDMLVTNEPIEWMLSPDSVGQIVEVGDDAKGKRKSSFWSTSTSPKAEKLGIDFARGRTSTESGLITKGTADRSDDLPIRKGQTWVSLTSPTGGVSKLTVLAPESDVWDKRRQTATIFWVDAGWSFPQPQVVNGTTPVRLETKVLRNDGLEGAAGWVVTYRSLNPEFAQFQMVSLDGARPNTTSPTVDAVVNPEGIASVYLVRMDNAASGLSNPKTGTALVEIEVKSKSDAAMGMPELSLARGNTSVTWNAPELVLDSAGPDRASPGQSTTYYAKVSNIGSVPAENVVLTVSLPTGMRLENTSFPPHRKTDQALIWDIGPLAAHRTFDVSIQAVPSAPGDMRVIFDLVSSTDKQQKSVPTAVEASRVSLVFAPKQNMGQVAVNGLVEFDCIVTNNGNTTANDVTVQLQSAAGLVHSLTRDNRVSQTIPVLRPGERVPLTPVFQVMQAGELRIQAEVLVQGVVSDSKVTSVLGVGGIAGPGPSVPPVNPNAGLPSNPMPGPGSPGPLPSNPGTFPGTPSGDLPGTLPPSGLLPGGLPPSNSPSSVLPPGLPPGLPSGGLLPGTSSKPAVGESESSGKSVVGSGVASTDRLSVSVQPLVQHIQRGDTVSYELKVENLVQQPDQKVSIAFSVPKGCKLIAVRALGLDYRQNESTGIVELTPIQYFRPRDTYTVSFQLKHEESKTQTVVASVRSRSQLEAVSSSTEVRVQ